MRKKKEKNSPEKEKTTVLVARSMKKRLLKWNFAISVYVLSSYRRDAHTIQLLSSIKDLIMVDDSQSVSRNLL